MARTNIAYLQGVCAVSAAKIEAVHAEYLQARRRYFANKFPGAMVVPPYEAPYTQVSPSPQVLRAFHWLFLCACWSCGGSGAGREQVVTQIYNCDPSQVHE